MRLEAAQRRIEAFGKRFGEAHLYLAYHAAFPLALTPDLLYRLWANFQRDINGEVLNIPWIAVADLLLSSLCDEVGHELYEMEGTVRNALLSKLKASPRFGTHRINELSDFLLGYVRQQLDSPDIDTRDFAQAQKWTALAYTQPSEAAHEIASALSKLKLENKAQWVRMASLIETFAEPLIEFEPLLVYARGMESFARGDLVRAADQFSKLRLQGHQVEVAGVGLKRPIEIAIQLPTSPTLTAPTSMNPNVKLGSPIDAPSSKQGKEPREFGIEEALNLTNNLVLEKTGKPLNSLEEALFKSAWENWRYEQLPKNDPVAGNYSFQYIRTVALKFWKLLTAVFQEANLLAPEEKITKRNLREYLNQIMKQRLSSRVVEDLQQTVLYTFAENPSQERFFAPRKPRAFSANNVGLQRLQKRRREKNYSYNELAEMAGVSLMLLQRLRRGDKVSKETIEAIAKSLDLQVTDIVDYKEWNPPPPKLATYLYGRFFAKSTKSANWSYTVLINCNSAKTAADILNSFRACNNPNEAVELFECLATRTNPPIEALVELLRSIKLEPVLALTIQAFGKIINADIKTKLKQSNDLLAMLSQQAQSGSSELIRWAAATTIESIGFDFIAVAQYLTDDPRRIAEKIVQSKMNRLIEQGVLNSDNDDDLVRFWTYLSVHMLRENEKVQLLELLDQASQSE